MEKNPNFLFNMFLDVKVASRIWIRQKKTGSNGSTTLISREEIIGLVADQAGYYKAMADKLIQVQFLSD